MTITNGLTTTEVLDRKTKGLANTDQEEGNIPILTILLQNILDLPTFAVCACIVFLIIYGQYQDAIMISTIMALNLVVSITQELRARFMLRKLKLLKRNNVSVIRDGRSKEIDSFEIVQDDVIVVQSGQYMYVDGVLLESDHLLVDESILTGESDYVKKNATDRVLSGSFVTGGRGKYKAIKVGKNSFVNQIAAQAKQYTNMKSPLQKNISNIVQILIGLTVLTLLLLFILNFFVFKMQTIELIGAAVSIVTSMVPQGIILTVTISLTLGTIRMARRKILVQKLNAVESLAGINVVCMDKTGTITENKLQMKYSQYLAKDIDEDTQKAMIASYCKVTLEKNKTIQVLERHHIWTEGATELKVIDEMPFNSKIKQSGIEGEFFGKKIRIMLGSIESLAARLADQTVLTDITKLNKQYATQGYRNLFMVYRWLNENETVKLGDENDGQYFPLAFFSLEDKLRDNAGEIIRAFIDRGVKPIIISGDNPQTLTALVQKLGVKELGQAITGSELNAIQDKKAFDEAVAKHDIFARVTPEQKVQIICSLQRLYKYVAMIGDGVNDALAIKQANLGIALGSGAQATKNISDVILLDDNLSNLNEVIVEGRRIIYNSRRGAQLIIAKNIYALVIIVMSLLLALPFPFNARGLFILSFFIGSITVLTILGDKTNPPLRHSFQASLYNFIFAAGISAGVIGMFILSTNRASYYLQTTLLTFLILTGQFNFLFSLNGGRLKIKTLHRLSSLVLILTLGYLACMYVPFLAQQFYLQPLGLEQWLTAITGLVGYIIFFNLIFRGLKKVFIK